MPHDSMRIFSEKVMFLEISTSSDRPVPLSQPQKNWGFSFGVNSILILLNYSNCTLVLFALAWNIALIFGVLPLILLSSIGLNQRLSAWLVIPPSSWLLNLCLFAARCVLYLFSTAITLVTALMIWPPVFHLQWLGHIPHGRHHLPTTIVWNSPMQELIDLVMVSSLLLLAFGTLSFLYFWFPSIFLSSKGRSIATLGTRWHDVFYYPF